MKHLYIILLLSTSIIFSYSFMKKGKVTDIIPNKGVAINNDFLTEEELIGSVLSQLNLEIEDCKQDLIVTKVLPNDTVKSVVVIPEIAIMDEDSLSFELHSHILVVNRKTGKIVSKFYESNKTNEWLSDGLRLASISIDTAPYLVKKGTRAFGIRVQYITSSQANPYDYETISLFIENNENLDRILDKFELSSYSGEWDTTCYGELYKVSKIFLMSSKTTNGYFDIIVKSKITQINLNVLKNGDCDRKEVITNQVSELAFDNTTYKKKLQKHKEYYKNGQLKELGVYRDSIKTGEWKRYYKNGQVHEVINYKNGEADGQYLSFYNDGKKKTAIRFKNGKKLTYIKYYHTGQIESKGNFEREQPLGEWTTFFENGQLRSTRVFEDGRTNDVLYHPNGKIKKIGSFQDSRKIGQWKEYYDSGQLKELKEYKNNKVVLQKNYYPNGNIKQVRNVNKRSIEFYDIDGKFVKEKIFYKKTK